MVVGRVVFAAGWLFVLDKAVVDLGAAVDRAVVVDKEVVGESKVVPGLIPEEVFRH